MTHIEKLKAERAKIALRIESLTSRLEKLDEKIMEMENMEIIGIVREYGLSIEQLAEMVKILDMIAEYNDNSKGDTIALATCHVFNEEKYDISKYVHDRGMKVPIVHDHITQEMTQLTTEEALQLIDLGTYVEICANSTVPWTSMMNWIVAWDYNINMTKELLKARGPEHICLITDSGLSGYTETEGMRMLIRGLLKNGVAVEDIKYMAGAAPASALGL